MVLNFYFILNFRKNIIYDWTRSTSQENKLFKLQKSRDLLNLYFQLSEDSISYLSFLNYLEFFSYLNMSKEV